MRVNVLGACLLAALVVPGAASAINCGSVANTPLPIRNSPVPPLFAGLQGRPISLATPRSLIGGESRDEALALDIVLTRMRLETCVKDEFANYKPKTQFDNTPYRFNLEKGKKFSPAEFDAWMKSRGVRIATGAKPAAVPATAMPAAATVPAAAAEVVVK